MPDINWFNILRSHQEFKARTRNLSFAERLEGFYRIFVGRLNQPETIDDDNYRALPEVSAPWDDDFEETVHTHFAARRLVGTRSTNHAGLYDIVTLGIPNIVESFFSGNFITSPVTRAIWQIAFSPIWVPLNLVRALFGAVFTAFTLIPLAIYHDFLGKPASEEVKISSNANDPAPINHASVATKALAKTNTVTLSQTEGVINLSPLNDILVDNENSYWKIHATTSMVQAKLKTVAPKHLDRYTAILIAEPADRNFGNYDHYQHRLQSTVGTQKLSSIENSKPSQLALTPVNEPAHGVPVVVAYPKRSNLRSFWLGDKNILGDRTYAFIPRLPR